MRKTIEACRNIVLRYFARLAADNRRDIERPAYPRYFMLDTGNVCNLRCPFCPTGKNVDGVCRGLMGRTEFDAILAKISPYAEFISMVNWGEPLLNNDLPYFAARCAALGIRSHIDSNLNTGYWSDAMAERIVASGIDSILGSIDGTTQEVYERYRVRGDLAMALHNLRALRDAKERLRTAKPFLGWAFYLHKFNAHQVEEARAMARDLDVDIWFKLLSCEDPSWQSEYHRNPHHPDLAVPSWVQGIYPDWRPQSIVNKPLAPDLPGVCVLPFGFMVINWNGDVYPCDVVYGEEFILGNLIEQDFDAIWFGSEYVKCRSFLRHYGPRQDSGSVCQNNPCPVARKWLYPSSQAAQ